MANSNLGLEQLDTDRLIGRKVVYHEMIESTMNEAICLAEQGMEEGAVVVAGRQTAGRGRFNRSWISEPGEDLLLSILLRPKTNQLCYVNMAATLAVSQVVRDMTGLQTSIKWPNDVRVRGQKMAGILIETAMDGSNIRYAVVGLGININSDPSANPHTGGAATSMALETGKEIPRARVLKNVLEALDDLYYTVRQGFSLTEQWSNEIDTLGKSVIVNYGDQIVTGVADGVDSEGNLIVTRDDGSTSTLVGGEVTLQNTVTGSA